MTVTTALKSFYYVFDSYVSPGMPAFAVDVVFSTTDVAEMATPPFNGNRKYERQLNVAQAAELGFDLGDICDKLASDVAIRLERTAGEIEELKADRATAESALVEERQSKAAMVGERDAAIAGLQSEIEELRATIAELEAQVKEEQAATGAFIMENKGLKEQLAESDNG